MIMSNHRAFSSQISSQHPDAISAHRRGCFPRCARRRSAFDQSAFDQIWPHLRVLARSSPADKLTLAEGLHHSHLYQDLYLLLVPVTCVMSNFKYPPADGRPLFQQNQFSAALILLIQIAVGATPNP